MTNSTQQSAEWRCAPCLTPGDTVRVVAPCGHFDRERFDAGIEILRERDLRVEFDDSLFSASRYLAGDDNRRASELQQAIDDDVPAIWIARGGYGLTRILPRIDFSRLNQRPKWLVGFSDVTALHAGWLRAHTLSVHGPNVTTLADWSEEARAALWATLFEGRAATLRGEWLACPGEAQGRIVGGNIAVLAAMAGTAQLPSFEGCIVCLEDIGERPYRLDRALTQLSHAGVFEGVAGFALGQLTGCEETGSSYTAEQVVTEILSDLGVPVLGRLAIGHEPSSQSVPLGALGMLDAASATLVCDLGQA